MQINVHCSKEIITKTRTVAKDFQRTVTCARALKGASDT